MKTTNNVKIFAKTVEDSALEQMQKLAEFEAYKHSKIRIMPDCHAGAGCTIGTTMEIKDKITPNLVGVDIGCGVLAVKLRENEIDLPKLDEVINTYVPSGINIHEKQQVEFDFSRLLCKRQVNIERAKLSLGSLGGGNHFIEIDKSEKGNLFLVIHSGSRNIGAQVARHYQKLAIRGMENKQKDADVKGLIEKLKAEGRQAEIQNAINEIKAKTKYLFDKQLAYVEGEDFEDYIHDMQIMQEYARLNRRTMANIILHKMGLTEDSSFESMHNYIDLKRMILRKGAISAEKGELLIIPINMRDGAIIGVGKGNPDWNYSAPHGAGRLMSRTQAFKTISLDTFEQQMKDIYSTSVSKETIDESPGAYKPLSEIIEQVKETIEILEIIKPIYNFKAKEAVYK